MAIVQAYYVRKEIPHHIAKTIGDPKIKHTAKHDISTELIESGGLIKRDPTRRKSVEEIPRVPEDKMHVEDIDEDTLYIDPHHINAADYAHRADVRNRERKAFLEPSESQMAEKVGTLSPDLEEMEVASVFARHERPKNPDVHYLYNMIINLRIRQKWIDKGHPIEGFAIAMQNELNNNEIDYQAIEIAENHNETIQILCNDPEEREHIIHILLKDQFILCIENGGKRYYSKFVDDDEKWMYKWARKEELKQMEEKGNLNKKHHDEVLGKINKLEETSND